MDSGVQGGWVPMDTGGWVVCAQPRFCSQVAMMCGSYVLQRDCQLELGVLILGRSR